MSKFNTIRSTVRLLLAIGMAAVLGACGSSSNSVIVIHHTPTPTPTAVRRQPRPRRRRLV